MSTMRLINSRYERGGRTKQVNMKSSLKAVENVSEI